MKEFAFDATARVVLRVQANSLSEARNAILKHFDCVELASIELDEVGIKITEASLWDIIGMFEEKEVE